MKTAIIQLIALAVVFCLALVYTIQHDRQFSRETNRTEMINTLLENDTYRSEIMEALEKRFPAEILETSFHMSDQNKSMQSEMMNQVIASCYANQNMRHTMMGMTMNMCDMDKENCSTLSTMLIHHPLTMECILDMLREKGLMTNVCHDQVLKNIIKESKKSEQAENAVSNP